VSPPPKDSARVVGPGFHKQVAACVKQVPRGRVATYGDIAGVLGARQVARHVGFALAGMDTSDVPWHRIVNARGRLSLTDGALTEQALRLIAEGIHVDGEGRIDGFRKLRLSETELETFRAPKR